ncbi:YoaK family protein [Falsiroseomonas sp.]|uniref:YoaK family protein n=1 Tax=Falsiroseomonas sp. TaxID=2870721 RepID=UPI003F70E3BE
MRTRLLPAILYAQRLVSDRRSEASDRHLAYALAFIAGAINAGGFFAVGHYTSHMSGIVSAVADHAALGQWVLVGAGLAAVLCFVLGAATSAWLINWGRRHDSTAQYALPLLLEGVLLAGLGLAGLAVEGGSAVGTMVTGAVALLCFIMGLQNATITKVSGARLRTTHVTGIVTDIGIELGKLGYWNRAGSRLGPRVRGDRAKLRLLGAMLGAFLAGGTLGALGFSHFGAAAALPLALLLGLLGTAPAAAAAVLRRREN